MTSAPQDAPVIPAMSLYNMKGDVNITWTPETEGEILALIQQKLDEGCVFFILEPRTFGPFTLGHRKVPVTNLAQVAAVRSVIVPDDEVKKMPLKLDDSTVSRLVSQGKAQLVTFSSREMQSRGTTKDPQTILRNQTAAVRRVVGG